MCGLFAGTGKLHAQELTSLGVSNVTRGHDSSGLAWFKDGQTKIAKIAQHPAAAFTITLRKDINDAAKSGVMIGHTRQATQGDITDRNAHPFMDSGIAFAHNGIILNDDQFGKYQVDSECLIHGIKAKDFSKFEGVIALIWIEEGKLHAFRKGNPLHRGRYKGGTYLASEAAHLRRIGCTNIRELSEGHIYVFKGANIESTTRVKSNAIWGYAGHTVQRESSTLRQKDWYKTDEHWWNEFEKADQKVSITDLTPDVPPDEHDYLPLPVTKRSCMSCDDEPALFGREYGIQCAKDLRLVY